jgi:hypothetical protein
MFNKLHALYTWDTWLYKENNKLRDWKNVFTLHIPPWAPHTYDFVVLTSLTHPRKILLVVLQIGKAKDLSSLYVRMCVFTWSVHYCCPMLKTWTSKYIFTKLPHTKLLKILLHGKRHIRGMSKCEDALLQTICCEHAEGIFNIWQSNKHESIHILKPIIKFMRKTDLQLMCIYVQTEYNIDLV